MAMKTDAHSNAVTQTCANAGLSDSSQYLSVACAATETMVKMTRMKQYWKTPTQTTCSTPR